MNQAREVFYQGSFPASLIYGQIVITHYKKRAPFDVSFWRWPQADRRPAMGSAKFVGMDVHKEAISIAVMHSAGKRIRESIIEKGHYHSTVYAGAARRRVCHL
jgi:hypothetical protein